MFEGKKVGMVLIGIAGVALVLLLKAVFPDLPDSTIEWAIGVVGGVPSLGALGQALADGMSKGLTSSRGGAILELERLKYGAAQNVGIGTGGDPVQRSKTFIESLTQPGAAPYPQSAG